MIKIDSSLAPSWRFLAAPAERVWQVIAAHAPAVGGAAALVFGLWIAARIARTVTARLLGLTRIDSALEGTWFARILGGVADGMTPSKALASLVYLAILIMALAGAADVLGLTAVQAALSSALSYVPKLASGVAALAIGGYAASAAGRGVGGALKELKSPFAGIAQSLVESIIMLVTITVAVNALGADLSFITSNLVVIFSIIAVTAAFLFCWSMRRPAEDIIANYYLRRMVRIGDELAFGQVEGKVERFAALGLFLRDESGLEHFVPARHVFEGLRRKPALTKRPKAP